MKKLLLAITIFVIGNLIGYGMMVFLNTPYYIAWIISLPSSYIAGLIFADYMAEKIFKF